MIYKFSSPATGDVVMLGPHGDQLLRLLGREPQPRGIIEPQHMPAAVAALRRAVAEDEAGAREAAGAAAREAAGAAAEDEPAQPRVGLRQRVWPMVQMLERAHAASKPVVWGV